MYFEIAAAVECYWLPSNKWVQRPQFGRLHFFTSWHSFEENCAFVNKRLRMYVWWPFAFNEFESGHNIPHFLSSCNIGLLSLITWNISGSFGLYADTQGIIPSSVLAWTVRRRSLSKAIAFSRPWLIICWGYFCLSKNDQFLHAVFVLFWYYCSYPAC